MPGQLGVFEVGGTCLVPCQKMQRICFLLPHKSFFKIFMHLKAKETNQLLAGLTDNHFAVKTFAEEILAKMC